jgi:hypothetical protein
MVCGLPPPANLIIDVASLLIFRIIFVKNVSQDARDRAVPEDLDEFTALL